MKEEIKESPSQEEPRMENEQFAEKKDSLAKKGRDVHITLKFIRHGERTPQITLPGGEVTGGALTDYGRKVTREKALEYRSRKGRYDIAGAMGSDAKPKGPTGMERSVESADIFAAKMDSGRTLETRAAPILSYETLANPIPYDHNKIYNESLPANFDELSDAEKAKASKQAQKTAFNYFMSLTSPEAVAYRREVAGSFARVIEHYMKAIKGIKSSTRAILPQGTHGGMMELLLHEALMRRDPDADGEEVRGFKDIEEIGGEFSPSESYDVEIETDENGNLQKLKVTFDNEGRPQEEMYLDVEKLQELKKFYMDLHPGNVNLRPKK